MIDPAVTVLVVADEPQRELVRRQRHVDHAGNAETVAAVFDRAEVTLRVSVELARVRLARDEADVAGHRVRSVQRALRAVEYFHALDVDELDRRVLAAAVLLVARSDDVLVEVGADHGRSAAVDAADDVLGIAGSQVLELQSRNAAGERFERRLALQRQIGAAEGVDRLRGFLHIRFAALGGRDYDLFQRTVARLRRLRRMHLCARGSAQHRRGTAAIEFPARSHGSPLFAMSGWSLMEFAVGFNRFGRARAASSLARKP